MNNFVLGIGAVLRSLSIFIKNFTQYQIFWGFAFGFLVSTLMHGYLISDNPKNIPTILFNDRATSFMKIYHRQRLKNGTYSIAFVDFIKIFDKVKFVFVLSSCIFLLIILLALIKF